jgi:hypothetical protein
LRTPGAQGRGLILGTALLSSFALHLLLAGRIPAGVDKDTASEVLRGLRLVILGRLEVLSFSNGPSAETLYLYVVGAATRLFGPRPLAVVLPAALTATLTILLVVLLVRRFEPRSSWGVPFALAAGSLWMFHYGQVGLRAVAAPFFLAASALAIGASETSDVRPLRQLGAGALLGLSVYAYSSCRILPVAWLLHEALRLLRERESRRVVLRQALLTGAGILFVSIPNLLFAVRYPSAFFSRGYDSFRGGTSEHVANVLATALLPVSYADRYRVPFGPGHAFDESGVALTLTGIDPVDPLIGALFLVGLVPALRLARRPEMSFSLVSLALSTLLLGLTGPSLTRMLLVLPVYLVVASLGLEALGRRGVRRWAVALSLSLFLVVQAWRYTRVFGRSPDARRHARGVANEIGARARDLAHQGKRVLIASTWDHHVIRFYCYRDIERVWLAAAFPPGAVPRVPLAAFAPDVVLVERLPEFEPLARSLGRPTVSHPDAGWDEFATPELAAALKGAPLRSNVRMLWSDIRF